jgi:7-carboxy-7-deazaguanine synthase
MTAPAARGREARMTRLLLSEMFVSVQGEGTLTGTPSIFIRTSGCNLRCRYCDTPYTSWQPGGTQTELSEILAFVARHPHVRHAVLTGGEPMIAKGFPELVAALKGLGLHITVETAATVFADLPVDLWSLSPKLANSTPGEEHGAWRQRHEQLRFQPDVLKAFIGSGRPWQLKLVVGDPADLAEVDAMVAALGVDPAQVLLMPEGVSVAALDHVAKWLVPACIARGHRYCDRLHIRLFGHTPGT